MYWRIFAWFLLANLATAAATFYITRPLFSAVTAHDLELQSLAETAVSLYESEGRIALGAWRRRQAAERRLDLQLLAPDGRPLLRPPPPRQRPAQAGAQPPQVNPSALRTTVTGRGGVYTLEAHLLPGFRSRGGLWLRLAVSVAVLALLALLLSRWLTRPIRRLTEVARRMAAGEFGARALPSIEPRGDEIGELAREFDQMAERIEQGIENQQRLLRDISHELRSPLARLEVALELARERGGAEAELSRIGLETGRINTLIDQILKLIRLESGAPLHREPTDLVELVQHVVDDARYAADGRVEIVWQPPALGVRRAVEPEQLTRAIDNVLRNALRYAPDGSSIDVSLHDDPQGPVIRIRDHGPGVEATQLPQLFDPFYRASAARERSSGGHGVGLAIVASVLRAHGGRASARNHPQGGLEISLALPAD